MSELKNIKLDWTDCFDKNLIIKNTNDFIDKVVLEIYYKKISLLSENNLSHKETAFLYRFPIHVGTNIFVERLLRVVSQKILGTNKTYSGCGFKAKYYKDIEGSVLNYFYDFSINNKLLNDISSVINGSSDIEKSVEQPRPQDQLMSSGISGIKSSVKKMLKKFVEFYVKTTKPSVVCEYSNWIKQIFPFYNFLWFKFDDGEYSVDEITRSKIKECCRHQFLKNIDLFVNDLDTNIKNKLVDLYVDFVDHVIPMSIVEGLNIRFNHYKELIKNWNVKQLHSYVGYYYNENYKIFAILAKRKNVTLVGYSHGSSNPSSSYKQCSNELAFVDKYFTWGKNDNSWMKGDRRLDNVDIISLGSCYLASINKWKKKEIDRDNIVLLYPTGPLMDFMSELEEITPERNYQQRLEVIKLFKSLWDIYPNLKVLYKPFPGTFTNDPVKEKLADELTEGKIRVITTRPLELYDKVDIVLWDSISTGFTESIQSDVPSLVFHSKSEYEHANQLGKELDMELLECGMLFYDVESGVKCFNNVINDFSGFLEKRKHPVTRFKDEIAHQISRKEFIVKLKENLANN